MGLKPRLAFASIRKLGKKLRDGKFSSVELTEFFLERLERLGPKFNAVATVTTELALAQALQADRELVLKAVKQDGYGDTNSDFWSDYYSMEITILFKGKKSVKFSESSKEWSVGLSGGEQKTLKDYDAVVAVIKKIIK